MPQHADAAGTAAPGVRSLARIRAGLAEAHGVVASFFGSLTIEELYRRRPGEWAPIQDLRHVTRTVGTFARGLALPGSELDERFGRPEGPSRTYEEILARYHAVLDDGFEAPARFVPPEVEPEDREAYRAERLARWNAVGAELLDVLERWDEAALDAHVLPHPALGTLTVREMLLFTHIHDLHHVEVARRRLAR